MVQQDQVKEMKEIQHLLIKETSIEQSLTVLHRDKENSRAIHSRDKGAFRKMPITGIHKMELLDIYQGGIETLHLLKINEQVRLFYPLCNVLSFTALCIVNGWYLRVLMQFELVFIATS